MGKKHRKLPRCIWHGKPPCPLCPVLLQCNHGNQVVNIGKQASHLIERADAYVREHPPVDKSNKSESLPDMRED